MCRSQSRMWFLYNFPICLDSLLRQPVTTLASEMCFLNLELMLAVYLEE